MKPYCPPMARCKAGVARRDITPPVGIQSRSWGAALHETAEGVHRPFTATALAIQSGSEKPLVLLSLDLGWLEQSETNLLFERVRADSGLEKPNLLIALSHTHSGPNLSRSLSDRPGGHLIAPYLDRLGRECAAAAKEAIHGLRDAWLTFDQGRCDLATNRDAWDGDSGQFVTGFNPEGRADDTLLVGRVSDISGQTMATIFNYGCHPTTLGPENRLLSPDYVAAAREILERHFAAPSLFLLGACGDSGPREGFVGDTAVADRNGRQLGFAAASALEAMLPPGQDFIYNGPIISGATLGSWKPRPVSAERSKASSVLRSRVIAIELPLKPKIPIEQLQLRYDETGRELEAAKASGDAVAIRNATAMRERARRQLLRAPDLPSGDFLPFEFWLWQIGDAFLLGVPAEPYSLFQTELRRRFPDRTILVSVVTNGTIAYLLPRHLYGKSIYQDWVSFCGPGCLETLIEAAADAIGGWAMGG